MCINILRLTLQDSEEVGMVLDSFQVTIIHDLEGRSRGYAFIEYDNENSLKQAYKNVRENFLSRATFDIQADGIKIDGRRVLVDVERGRTVSGWIPRRMGGGRGSGR